MYWFLKLKKIKIINKLIIANDLDNPVILGFTLFKILNSLSENNAPKLKFFISGIFGKIIKIKTNNKKNIDIQKKCLIRFSLIISHE